MLETQRIVSEQPDESVEASLDVDEDTATDDEQQSLSGLEGVVPAHASIEDELATETLSIAHEHADDSIDHGAAHEADDEDDSEDDLDQTIEEPNFPEVLEEDIRRLQRERLGHAPSWCLRSVVCCC